MTDRIQLQLEQLRKRDYRKTRIHTDLDMTSQLAGLDIMMRNAGLMAAMTKQQEPRFTIDDRIGFHRSHMDYPYVILEDGTKFTMFHSSGNLVPDYQAALHLGLDAMLENVKAVRESADLLRR